MERLHALIDDEHGVEFVMQFVDRVARPDGNRTAADQLAAIVDGTRLPAFLTPIDRAMLRIGARLAPRAPDLVVPLARRRMRAIVGLLVAPAETGALTAHLARQRQSGYDLNVNLLGEAVLGEREAEARLTRLIRLLALPDVDYVSVKISAIASQLNHWDHEGSLRRVRERIARLVDAAAAVDPPTFVNLDMEEYHDLELTVAAFRAVLDEPGRRHLDAGIVLQAYLPDVFEILGELVGWAGRRHDDGGGTIKIRLVKGANLAMERVDAAMHGWEQVTYSTKVESDANYRRCLEWALVPERLRGVRIGVASHNLFDVAWAKLLADERGVASRVQFEMLQGMAPGQARAVNESTAGTAASALLLYTPAVAADDFDVAIGYLFRRLEENASADNFLRSLFDLRPGSRDFEEQEALFRDGMAMRHTLRSGPARTQDRAAPISPWSVDEPFRNEPDTDPVLRANRAWIASVAGDAPTACREPLTTDVEELDRRIDAARRGAAVWRAVGAQTRRTVLRRVGDELARRRGELITAMMHEASKVFSEADVEVSEAIDFARWYADRGAELGAVHGAGFEPFGVVGVVPPWNFPVAIPAGGVLASLAAANAVVFKPAPETPRCAEIVAEACWAGGVPEGALQFVRTPDDHVGRHLVESVDAVILTGSTVTADLFRSWKPDIELRAETSGKNALIITPSADLDLAAHDLVRSAFGHAGQKCSAASLAILVGEAYESPRLRRQLVDAVQSLTVGSSLDLGTDVPPLVGGGNERLHRAATRLDAGERWLVRPVVDGATISPGIRDGVQPGSWFHRTECFGPVLGLMRAPDLDAAIDIANSGEFGLTGGIHSLDPTEVERWVATHRGRQRLRQPADHGGDRAPAAVRWVEAELGRAGSQGRRAELRDAARPLDPDRRPRRLRPAVARPLRRRPGRDRPVLRGQRLPVPAAAPDRPAASDRVPPSPTSRRSGAPPASPASRSSAPTPTPSATRTSLRGCRRSASSASGGRRPAGRGAPAARRSGGHPPRGRPGHPGGPDRAPALRPRAVAVGHPPPLRQPGRHVVPDHGGHVADLDDAGGGARARRGEPLERVERGEGDQEQRRREADQHQGEDAGVQQPRRGDPDVAHRDRRPGRPVQPARRAPRRRPSA